MPNAWPPPTAPAWPPPGYVSLEFSDLDAAQEFIAQNGWSTRQPTNAETTAYFKDARCDEGHKVSGVIVVTDTGVAYPFARCNGPTGERVFLVLWGPDYVHGVT